MAVIIPEQLFKEVCAYLASRSEEDEKASDLFNQLQEVEIEHASEEAIAEGIIRTQGGSFIV